MAGWARCSINARRIERSRTPGPLMPINPAGTVVRVVANTSASGSFERKLIMKAHCRSICLVTLVGLLVPGGFAAAESDLYRPVSLGDVREGDRRFYLSGILGPSWGTLQVEDSPSVNDPLFSAGGAAGVAFERESGRLRVEFEARYRDPIGGAFGDADSSSSLRAANGWSTLVNAWRDIDLTDRLGIYVGGGIGGGGYGSLAVQSAVPASNFTINGSGSASGFAWQAGGGLIYDLTERITLDLGYRFFEIDSGSITATSAQPGVPIETLSLGSGFSASELLFSIRIYEPFRGWR
jgi:opacity protein-like surface antigen